MLQEIKDEILENGPRYRIRDNNGNIIQDNINIEQITGIIQEGTPINKAVLSNIQGDLYSQDRYNTPIVKYQDLKYVNNIDISLTSYEKGKVIKMEGVYGSGNALIKSNCIPTSWTKNSDIDYNASNGDKLTFASAGTSTVGLYPGTSSDQQLSNISNANTSSYARIYRRYNNGNATETCYIQYTPATPIGISKLKIMGSIGIQSGYLPESCFEASDDGITWTKLVDFTSDLGLTYNSYTTVDVNNTKIWNMYRIKLTAVLPEKGSSGSIDIYEMQVAEYYIFQEKVSTFYSPYLNINNLGEKQINSIIKAGEKYTLIYNGESWDVVSTNVVTGSFGASSSRLTFNLGFTPDIVIAYAYYNNLGTIAVSKNSADYYYVPRVLTKAYTSDSGSIIENGFNFSSSLMSGSYGTVYYIAIKF